MKIRISPHETIEGAAFPSNVHLENYSGLGYHNSSSEKPKSRDYMFLFLIIIVFGFIIVKLFFLQIFGGSYYRRLSDSNRIRTTVVHAPRGVIFDRNGVPLVFNTPGFREVINKKTKLLTQEQAVDIIASGKTDLEVDSLREYPYKDSFSHVLGYIGQISKEELGFSDFSSYHIDDLVGKMGIELEYEKLLRGIDGRQLVEVDAIGKAVRKLGETDPISGKDINLTLDAKLQKAAYLALANVKKGAVIVSTPDGQILTMISKPTFDPNFFTLGSDYKNENSKYGSVLEILQDSNNQPMLNRSISGTYPPGSTFKLITAASALSEKVIDESFEVRDSGILQIGAFSFANWYYTQYGRTEGFVDVVKGLKRSNDIFFYKAAEMVGVDKLSQTAFKFGVGKKSGIDLPGEASGVLPTQTWKNKIIGEPWYLGDTYHYGIGQGYLLTTPLQVNSWTQVIANGGTLYKPQFLKDQKSSASWRIKDQKLISDKTRNLIRQGMIESCSPGGVAWPLFEFKVQSSKFKVDGKNFMEVSQATTSANFRDYRQVTIACKTGTAQHGGEQTLPHAWITLFAPAYDPEIVITVLAESSGEGSNIAAPVAKKILEEWFSR